MKLELGLVYKSKLCWGYGSVTFWLLFGLILLSLNIFIHLFDKLGRRLR